MSKHEHTPPPCLAGPPETRCIEVNGFTHHRCRHTYEIAVTEADLEYAKKLLAEGYQQVSAKYRHVARLPEGKTGIEALIEADPSDHWLRQYERGCASQYRRVYATYAGLVVVLTREQFAAFKRLGGEAA